VKEEQLQKEGYKGYFIIMNIKNSERNLKKIHHIKIQHKIITLDFKLNL